MSRHPTRVTTILGASAALAFGLQPVEASAGNSAALSAMLGSDTAFDGDPATFRLTVQGQTDLAYGDVVGLAVAVPVTWMSGGTDGFGIDPRQSVVEVPPSLRLRLLSALPVRPYADLGVGVVLASRPNDGWLLGGHTAVAGWMTRSAIGVEIGGIEGPFFVVEPLSFQTYHLDLDYSRVGLMLGGGARF